MQNMSIPLPPRPPHVYIRRTNYLVDPGYVTTITHADRSNLEHRVNFSDLINPSAGPVDTSNVSLYEALKSVIEWTGQVRATFCACSVDGSISLLFRGMYLYDESYC